MFRLKTVLSCLIVLMLAGLVAGLFRSYSLRQDAEKALVLLPEDTDVSLNHIHHVATKNGVRQWALDAESVQYQKAKNMSILEKVSVTFFLKGGETVLVTGDEGTFETDTKAMEISGNVIISSGSNNMKTDWLRYDHVSRSVSTDRPVILEGDGVRLTGNNMVFSFASEQAIVWGNVQAVLDNFHI